MKKIFVVLCVSVLAVLVIAQSQFPNTVVAPTFRHTNGPAVVGQVLTATSTAGAMAWSNVTASAGARQIIFATGTSLAGTNMFTFSHTNGTVDLINFETERGLRLNADGLQQSFSSADLYFGVSAKTNAWYIEGDAATITFGSWLPGASNVVSLGSSTATASNVWANDIYAKTTVSVGAGSGTAATMTLSDASGTNYQYRTPGMSSNIFERGPKNQTPGVRVFVNESGTNQATNVTLEAGQYVTVNASGAYVAGGITVSNLVAPGNANYTLTTTMTNVTLGTSQLTNVLPTAGTYLITASVIFAGDAAGTGDLPVLQLWCSDGIIGVVKYQTQTAAAQYISFQFCTPVTITGSRTVWVQAQNSTSARGSIVQLACSIHSIRLL